MVKFVIISFVFKVSGRTSCRVKQIMYLYGETMADTVSIAYGFVVKCTEFNCLCILKNKSFT